MRMHTQCTDQSVFPDWKYVWTHQVPVGMFSGVWPLPKNCTKLQQTWEETKSIFRKKKKLQILGNGKNLQILRKLLWLLDGCQGLSVLRTGPCFNRRIGSLLLRAEHSCLPRAHLVQPWLPLYSCIYQESREGSVRSRGGASVLVRRYSRDSPFGDTVIRQSVACKHPDLVGLRGSHFYGEHHSVHGILLRQPQQTTLKTTDLEEIEQNNWRTWIQAIKIGTDGRVRCYYFLKFPV